MKLVIDDHEIELSRPSIPIPPAERVVPALTRLYAILSLLILAFTTTAVLH